MIKLNFLLFLFFITQLNSFAKPLDLATITKLEVVKNHPELIRLLEAHQKFIQLFDSGGTSADVDFSAYFNTGTVGRDVINELEKVINFYDVEIDATGNFNGESLAFFKNVNELNNNQIKEIINRIMNSTVTYQDYFLIHKHLLTYYDIITFYEAQLRFVKNLTDVDIIEDLKNKLTLKDIIPEIKVGGGGERYYYTYLPEGVLSNAHNEKNPKKIYSQDGCLLNNQIVNTLMLY
ncbi:MAG: hypothetical protein QE271_01620 [Bacteriovoracaceae bacterium]|nr:hypothetical protein [Bacteriovoracaceae bacterium]